MIALVAAGAALLGATLAAQESFRFKSGVELINVTATVSDENGRFVSGLRQEDFSLFDEGERQTITHFNSERVPVSLGIALDSSGSMDREKMDAARAAIERLVMELLGPDDELFFIEFSDRVRTVQDWTSDRRALIRAVDRVIPRGGTAMYDAVAEALPIAASGKHQKKAILVISDGNDTDSRIRVGELRQAIRESEVLVYALGVDSTAAAPRIRPPVQQPIPIPLPFPIPGGRRRPPGFPQILGGGQIGRGPGERVNADALRQITDDTGGRTEIVRGFNGLDAATARIADELSKQYYLGYSTTRERDGRWHAIRVEVKDRRLTVRSRRGYIAS